MILVVGATGVLGGSIVRRLRQRGAEVAALVRDQSDDSGLRAQGVEVVRGDLLDPESLRDACARVDTVVASATAIGRRLAGAREASIRRVDHAGMQALVSAAEAAGVSRFVYVSYAGADTPIGSPLEQAKLATEHRLRNSPMRAVIVRPDAFQEVHFSPLARFDVPAGKVAIFGKGDTKRRWVSIEDVAALIVAVAVDPDPPELIEFGGPEAISRNEAVVVAEQASGRVIKRQRMPRAAARLGVRLIARRNDALASVFGAGLHQDLVEATWDDSPLRAYGIEPRLASEFIRRSAEAARSEPAVR